MRHTRCSLLQVSSNRFSELSGMANSCEIALVRLTASKSFISTQGSEDGTYATVHLRFRFSFKACCEKVKRKSIKERLGGGGRWAGTDWRPHGETRLCSYHSNSETLTLVIKITCGCLEENVLYNDYSVCACMGEQEYTGSRGSAGSGFTFNAEHFQ